MLFSPLNSNIQDIVLDITETVVYQSDLVCWTDEKNYSALFGLKKWKLAINLE